MILSLWALFLLSIFTLVILAEHITDPTLKPFQSFIAEQDARVIRQEVKSKWIFANREKLVRLWFHRTYDQRDQITQIYDSYYCQYYHANSDLCPLSRALQALSTDSMKKLYRMSMHSIEGILAETIYKTINGNLKETGAIEEVVCGNDIDMKNRIIDYYKAGE